MASTTKKTSSIPSKSTASKATASKATAGKSTTTKAAATKATATKAAAKADISHTVTFTQTPEDQELLEAIAEELAEQTFESFEQVCKEALRYFLFEDDVEEIEQEELTEGTPPDSSQSVTLYLEQHLGHVLQRLEQIEAVVGQPLALLQQQVTNLENTLAQKDVQHLTELTLQLDRLGQQVERLEASALPEASSSEGLLIDAPPGVDASSEAGTAEAAIAESSVESAPDSAAAPSPSQKTLDPRLSLLSALLEDF